MNDVSELAARKVHQPGLITRGISGLLRLSWNLFVLQFSVIRRVAGLITGSIRLGIWVTGGVLSYSLSMIGLTSSGRHRQPPPESINLPSEFENRSNLDSPPSPPASISESATASEAFNFLSKFENTFNKESVPSPSVSISESATASEAIDFLSEDQNQVEEKAKSLGPEPGKGPNVTQVLVRLPNGERISRRFHFNATLQSIYDFVDSSKCLEVGSYTLVTFFPRVLYGEEELSSTIEELGLYTQASLFVELKT